MKLHNVDCALSAKSWMKPACNEADTSSYRSTQLYRVCCRPNVDGWTCRCHDSVRIAYVLFELMFHPYGPLSMGRNRKTSERSNKVNCSFRIFTPSFKYIFVLPFVPSDQIVFINVSWQALLRTDIGTFQLQLFSTLKSYVVSRKIYKCWNGNGRKDISVGFFDVYLSR